ncbi:MAG: DUF1573 domain-containing protein [Prevotellaceae bacterium]|jgi:hypothetical protein|nr:DUF1573 domain-containing protein [Prevotellaceae bacterium]
MRSKVFIFGLFCFLSSNLFAQKAEISFKKETHDFGDIKEANGPVSCVFAYTNTGKAPLILQNVEPSCGCTTPEWTREPIMPGKSGSIKATYDPAGRAYPFDKTITVTSNAEKNSRIVLHIKGKVEAKVPTIEDTYPNVVGDLRMRANAIEMGRIAATGIRTESLEVINTGKTPVITSFENVPAHIQLSVNPVSIPAGKTGTITCIYNAARKNEFGPCTDVVVIKNRSNKSELKIKATIDEDLSKITAEQAPVIQINNYSHNFNTINKGDKVTGLFEVSNTGKSDLIIRKITNDCPCVQSKISATTIKPGAKATLELQLTAGESGDKYYNTTLTTNSPQNRQISLFMMGTVK